MLPHFLQLLPDQRSQANTLKDDVVLFRQELDHALEEIWDMSPTLAEGPENEGHQARRTEGLEKPVKPVLRIEMLDTLLLR
jgi:hypothetical protein